MSNPTPPRKPQRPPFEPTDPIPAKRPPSPPPEPRIPSDDEE
jgi:hypothetical protein